MRNITNIPNTQVNLTNPATGEITHPWRRFFENLWTLQGRGTSDLTVQQVQDELRILPSPATDNVATSAALVSYLPAGAQAVLTTVQAKLREGVSAKDFGAVGDGIADDTLAIQAAINQLELAGIGGVVYLPTGQYKITANLVFSWPNMTSGYLLGRVVIRGDGAGLTQILDYRTSVGTGGALQFDFSSYVGSAVDGHYLMTWFGGFSLIKMVNATVVVGFSITPGTGVGIYMNKVPSGVLRDMTVKGYATNISLIDCLGYTLQDLILNECDIAVSSRSSA